MILRSSLRGFSMRPEDFGSALNIVECVQTV